METIGFRRLFAQCVLVRRVMRPTVVSNSSWKMLNTYKLDVDPVILCSFSILKTVDEKKEYNKMERIGHGRLFTRCVVTGGFVTTATHCHNQVAFKGKTLPTIG